MARERVERAVLMSLVVPDGLSVPRSAAQMRPIAASDVADLADASWRSYRDESPGFTLSHATQDTERILSGHHGRLAHEASLIAETEGRTAGAVITVIDPPYPGTPAGPYIADLYVAPGERRRGVATALLLTALAALGGRTVHLRVDADNEPALRLYTAHGFAPVSEDQVS